MIETATIDGLVDILDKNSNEAVLLWLINDERIVNNTNEPEKRKQNGVS